MQIVYPTLRHARMNRFIGLAVLLTMMMGVWGQTAFAQDFSSVKAAIESKNYDKAITELRAILAEKEKSHEGHYLLGLALKATGQLDEALAEFAESADRKKSFTDAWYELGMLQIEKERYEEAEKSLAEGEKRSKGQEPRFFYAQGMLKVAQNRLGEATQLVSKALAVEPNNALYHQGLGDIYRAREVWGMAINEYNKSLALDPDSPEAARTHYRLGNLHFNSAVSSRNSQQFNSAVEEYKEATALDSTIADAWYQQGYIYFLAKQFAVAVAPLEKSVALQPNHFESNYYLAQCLNETRRLKEAVPYYEKALQLNPEASDCYAGLADGYFVMNEYRKAVDAYKRAVELSPDDPALVYSLGWTQAQEAVGQYEEAIVNLKRAIELDPSTEKPHIQLALIYFNRENYTDAIPHLKKAIEINPEDQNPYAYLGRSYIMQGQYDAAVTEIAQKLNPVIEKQTDPSRLSNVYFTLGQELYKEKQYQAAIQMYQQKVAFDTTSYATYLNLGLAGLVGKEYQVAKDAFLRSVDLKLNDPDSTAVLQPMRFLGMTYLSMDDNASAKKTYQQILNRDPLNDDALYRMGVFALIEKRFGAAEKNLKQAIELKPDNASYHLALAQTYTNSQRLNEAVRAYRAVLKLDPNNTTAQDQLNTVLEALEAQN